MVPFNPMAEIHGAWTWHNMAVAAERIHYNQLDATQTMVYFLLSMHGYAAVQQVKAT